MRSRADPLLGGKMIHRYVRSQTELSEVLSNEPAVGLTSVEFP